MSLSEEVINKQRITGVIFNEILLQVKLLLELKGDCSKGEIKNQFSNLQDSVIKVFLSEALECGIIEVDMGGTYTLQKFKMSII